MKNMTMWIMEIECGLHSDLCCLSPDTNPGLLHKVEGMFEDLSETEIWALIRLACQCACKKAAPAPACPLPPTPTPPGVTPPPVTPPATCPSPLTNTQ